MKKTVLILLLVLILVSGAVVGYLFLGRGDEEGESEGAPKEEVVTGQTSPESRSLFLAADKKESEIAPVSRRSLGLSPREYAKLTAKSRKLGAIPEGEEPVEVEEFDYLTIEETDESRQLDVIGRLKRLAREAQKQNFLVLAQPYLRLLPGFDPTKPDDTKVEVALPVIKTSEPKPPLVLRHAKFGRVFVSNVVSAGDLTAVARELTATLERARKRGFKVSKVLWARVESETWTQLASINECMLRAVVPVE